jgi:hypothetical protein
MPSNFMDNFRAGWQFAAAREENSRRNQELQMEQQRQQQRMQQEELDRQLRRESLDLQKKQINTQIAQHDFESKAKAAAMMSEQQQLAPPSTEDLGGGATLNFGAMTQPRAPMMAEVPGAPGTQVQVPFFEELLRRKKAQDEQDAQMAATQAGAVAKAQEPFKISDDERASKLQAQRDAANISRTVAALGGMGGSASPVLDVTAQGLANYELGLADLGRMGKGEKAIVFAKAKQLNPDFNASLYASRQKLRADFTSGKTANNIDSLNTAVDHLNTLATYADALKTGNVQLANQVAQSFSTATGQPEVTNFKTMATAVESEVASLLKKTGATDQEISSWRGNFSSAQSPAQLKGALNTVLKVMHGREQALQQRWKTGMGSKTEYPIYGEEQAKILESLAAKEGGGAPTVSKYKIIEVK